MPTKTAARSTAAEAPTTTDLPGMSDDQLTDHRERLAAQLTNLRSQHVDVIKDLGGVEQDWRAALAAQTDTRLISERRKHRGAEADDLTRSIQQVQEWISDADRELDRRAPHQLLDHDIDQFRRDVTDFTEHIAGLDTAVDDAVQTVIDAITTLHTRSMTAVDRTEQLTTRAHELRHRSTALDRADELPNLPAWQTIGEQRHRSADTWRGWLFATNPRHRQHPQELLAVIAQTAHHRLLAAVAESRYPTQRRP